MKRGATAGAALAATVALVLPVSADAPISGPDRQYEPFVESDTSVTDNFTKLRWTRRSFDLMSFGAAEAQCSSLGNGNRLPSVKELLTLVDEDPHVEYVSLQNEPRFIDRRAFGGTLSEQYWTSSAPRDSSTSRFTVDFTSGFVARAPTNLNRAVRCVR